MCWCTLIFAVCAVQSEERDEAESALFTICIELPGYTGGREVVQVVVGVIFYLVESAGSDRLWTPGCHTPHCAAI